MIPTPSPTHLSRPLPSNARPPAPPSTAAIALATAILGVLAGYFFAQASSLGLFSSSSSVRASKRGNVPKKSRPNSCNVTLHPELIKRLRADSGGGDDSSEEETVTLHPELIKRLRADSGGGDDSSEEETVTMHPELIKRLPADSREGDDSSEEETVTLRPELMKRLRAMSRNGDDSSEEETVTWHPELIKRLRADSGDGDDSSEEETEDDGTGLRAFEGYRDECKMVLVVRTDLGMQKGKIAAQCSHATLSNYRLLLSHPHLNPLLRRWESTGQAKIALQAPPPLAGGGGNGDGGVGKMHVSGEGELEKLRAQARQLGLCATIVHDAGRTQIAAGSATVLGVGPGPKSVVDRITGGLKLL